ncbi:GH25 family lysozyme [Brachybacterium sp. AOP29-B2-41]|uniref:GH25 family lysozyme n=1 Tax=Brachybacterium sp. AOP29-B2-41 TaxID=3457704 RepID=UPI0040339CBA
MTTGSARSGRARRLSRSALLRSVLLPLAAVASALAVLVATGVVWPGRIFAHGYEVRGADVSSYQGEIDWPTFAGDDLDFAYIKATEGSSYVDEQFTQNWEHARDTGLFVGAYHFVSFESSGRSQAQHVIDTVGGDGALPNAVDIEFYGDYFEDPPSREAVDTILAPLLEELTEHYGVPPVIYTTADAYDLYIAGAYPDSPIWIRSVVLPPDLNDGRGWTFWQYSHRDHRDGYDGEERYVDMNVFTGSRAELAALASVEPTDQTQAR